MAAHSRSLQGEGGFGGCLGQLEVLVFGLLVMAGNVSAALDSLAILFHQLL